MVIANPRVHIICGVCGNKDMMQYRLAERLNDDTGEKSTVPVLSCKNCATLTYLDELLTHYQN